MRNPALYDHSPNMPHLSIITPHHSYPHFIAILSILFFLLATTLRAIEARFVIEWTFFSLNSTQITTPVLLDPISAIFIATVTFISFNVLTFSKTYITDEPNLTRFTHLVALFILSILLLIISPNLISIILGWDGLGFTRFLLVIFYQNPQSIKRGIITALTNRVGDALLLVAIAFVISQGHWRITRIWIEIIYSPSVTTIIITIAAITKRAQYPFVAWLPEAIAAPTPVSALVHSSTLVTAGVFILIRLYPFLSETKAFNRVLLSSGLFTALFGAIWASAHPDQKKTVALSTLRQLGLIIVTLSLNIVTFCFIHLLTHAIFKATLFISVGVSIIYKHHRQFKANLRIHTYLPPVRAAAGISLLAINAFFFTAGYYSKELILETSIYNPWTFTVFIVLGIATYYTTIYSVPLWRINVISRLTQSQYPYENATLAPKVWYVNSKNKSLITPVILISLASITIGRIGFGFFLSPSEVPILPDHKHSAALIWPTLGLLTAVNFCRQTTKYKNPSSIYGELCVFAFDQARKNYIIYLKEKEEIWKTFSFPIKIFVISSLVKIKLGIHLHKRKHLKQFNLSDANLWTWKKLNYRQHESHIIADKDSIRHKSGNIWDLLDFTYELAIPVLTISLSTLKALDQGIITIFSADGFKKTFPGLSKLTLIHQANHSTKTLILFILLIFIFIPLII